MISAARCFIAEFNQEVRFVGHKVVSAEASTNQSLSCWDKIGMMPKWVYCLLFDLCFCVSYNLHYGGILYPCHGLALMFPALVL